MLYGHDAADVQKQRTATLLIDRLIAADELTLSAQILNEFFWNAIRPPRARPKGPPLMSADEAARIVKRWCQLLPIIPLTASVTERALDALPVHGLSFWDALIWSAAKANGVTTIYRKTSSTAGISTA